LERKRISLACDVCGARNYKTTKNSRLKPGERLQLKKFCPACQQHTQHSETK
jgi:large subunit ribosomal protein L33